MTQAHRGQRHCYAFEHEAEGSAEAVFPLLCPVRERDWVPGWEADIVYSESGVAEAGCVFRVHKHGQPTTWIVTRYEPDTYRIQFAIFHGDSHLEQLDVHLTPARTDRCRVHWGRTFTTLNPQGEAAMKAYDEATFRKHMGDLAGHLDGYLRSGMGVN